MMRGLGKGFVTLAILFAMAVGGYYAYRKQLKDDYPIAYAPVDLLKEVAGIFTSDGNSDAAEPSPALAARREPDRSPSDAAPTPDAFERGRELYLAADYSEAIPLLSDARRDPGERATVEIDTVLSRARLFEILLRGVEPDSGLEGPPVALLTPLRGEPMLVTLESEDEESISIRTGTGSAKLEKSEIAALRIARNREARVALFREEYRKRHEKLETAAEYLDLARYALAHGMPDHVTYLMEHALKAPGDGLEAALHDEYRGFLSDGEMARAEVSKDLMRQFFREGKYTLKVFGSRPPKTGPVAKGPRPEFGGAEPRPGKGTVRPDGEPASGIGSVGNRKKRSLDPEVNALLEKADRLKGDAEDHYRQAFPGMPDRAKHREDALRLYTEAREIYLSLEEKWGVKFESTIKELNTRIYELRKDTPVK